jgi:hypothetical protein
VDRTHVVDRRKSTERDKSWGLPDRDAKIAELEAQIRESASGSPSTHARGISLVGKRLSVSVDLDTVYNPAAAAAESGNTSELELAAFRDSIPNN